ncbi:DALR anticodon-binding domain-containing protein 3-like isoform X1 [Battus philenor]|uniref:DALR anticodon-binding domain-containing protein 3-like isoform X1 n=1 Tax=Battus philenor TaxID=42288 RepID=UPI0035D0C48E
MLDDPLNIFAEDLCQFLLGQNKVIKGLLVKKHSVNLQTQGEFSFPSSVKSWHQYIGSCRPDFEGDILEYVGKNVEDIVNASQQWNLSIKNIKVIKDRVHIFINRGAGIKLGLSTSLVNKDRLVECLSKRKCFARVDKTCEGTCVTSLRLKCLSEVINNLFAISPSDPGHSQGVVVTWKSSGSAAEGSSLLCGAVLNASTGLKEETLSGEDFIRLRQNELTLIAQHKYGVRVATDDKWREFIAHLGESAVTFELLQTKPSCAVKINFDVSSGCSKGAAFVLYNCARLDTIIRTYNERVTEGTYPPLPDFQHTDFSLLTQEEEWCLVFHYALGLPAALRSAAARPHLLCAFLSSMVKLISQYYRKTRVLTEPRKHLLPVMFARLHLLTILNENLKICLRVLNIKSVSQM